MLTSDTPLTRNIKFSKNEFQEISGFVLKHFGINLSKKQTLISNRLRQTIIESGFNTFGEYFAYVKQSQNWQALNLFVNKLTTNHTYFYREPDHFSFLHSVGFSQIEALLANSGTNEVLIWSAGCSSGEEAYTLAMEAYEFFAKKFSYKISILATDLSQHALQKAKTGIYSSAQLTDVPDRKKLKYFTRLKNDMFVVKDFIKELVCFKRLNLIRKSFPFKGHFHLVVCRNVMIYFKNETKVNLIKKFYDRTIEGGYLFVGHSEAFKSSNVAYHYVKPSIYMKADTQ